MDPPMVGRTNGEHAASSYEAFEVGHAPRVVLRATNEGALEHCSLADLKRFAVDLA
jgi:uncharacterized protein (DUF2237 family)